MTEAFLTSLGLIIVALVTVGGQWLNGRNDRALTHQEVDLLAKLNPDSLAAAQLRAVIQDRINRWHVRTRPWFQMYRRVWRTLGVGYLVLTVSILLLPWPDAKKILDSNWTYWFLILVAAVIGALAFRFFLWGRSAARQEEQEWNKAQASREAP